MSRECRNKFKINFKIDKLKIWMIKLEIKIDRENGNILFYDSKTLLQTSCTMDQNLARLQNPHRFLRENRFLEGDDPSMYFI